VSDDLLHPQRAPRPTGARAAVLRLSGELDLASASRTWVRLEGAASGGCPELVVDLAAVPFCDVSGVNVLLRARSVLAARGATLRLRGADERLRALLADLGVADLLPVE
jgi:anti-sigma B factor antagonist